MTGLQLFAFVILPILIVVIAWIGVLLHERDIRRSEPAEKLHPGE
jgi:hypothetical protein